MTDDECNAPNLRLAVPNAQIDSTFQRRGRRFAQRPRTPQVPQSLPTWPGEHGSAPVIRHGCTPAQPRGGPRSSRVPAGGQAARPAGPRRDHRHRAGQHDDSPAPAAGANLAAREHRGDRTRRQPSAAREARATGVHVMIGPPTSPRVVLPIIASSRGCALLRL